MKSLVDNKKIVIGFDLDGVIIDHTENKISIAKRFGVDLDIKQTPSERMWKVITGDMKRRISHLLYDNPDIALSAPLITGALEGLEFVHSRFPYFLVSRRSHIDTAVKLLKRHKLWPHYFSDHNTFFVVEPADKNVKAIELGITHYIDDELKVIDALSSVPIKFLFDQHDVFEDADHYLRVTNWQEFLNHLRQL